MACEDLRRNDIKAMGERMFQTHEGLSKEYEVSCKELDFLVTSVKNHKDVLGARMMGGGFGGCTINLIKENAIDKLTEEIGEIYQQQMNLPLTVYTTEIEDGTGLL